MKKSQENLSQKPDLTDYVSCIMQTLPNQGTIIFNIETRQENDNFYGLFNEILHNSNYSHWSKLEDELLLGYVTKNKPNNWRNVAEFIKTKTSQQCAYRYNKLIGDYQKKKWSKEEDLQLVELVEVYGNNWDTIAGLIKRDPKEIEIRYREKLDPRIKRCKFSQEEDELLITLHKQFGNNWAEIADRMQNRSQMMIKNRYYSNIRKKLQLEERSLKDLDYCDKNTSFLFHLNKKNHESIDNEVDDNNLLENALKCLSLSIENPSEHIRLIDSIFLKIFEFYKGKNRKIDYFYPCNIYS